MKALLIVAYCCGGSTTVAELSSMKLCEAAKKAIHEAYVPEKYIRCLPIEQE